MIFFAEKGTKLTDIEKNKARVRAFFNALNCGDVEAVVNAYSEDGSCWTLGGTLISGTMNKEQIRASSGAIFEAFPQGLEFSFTQ